MFTGDVLKEILRAADKHPNSRVAKLIRQVEDKPSQKNIVLLLIELAEHTEYSIDFGISLSYVSYCVCVCFINIHIINKNLFLSLQQYLDLFEKLGKNRDLVLNEAGLLLVNSSKLYSKRVDYVQSLVERQILTLSNADHEIEEQK